MKLSIVKKITRNFSSKLELKANKYVLGEFLEFKGKQEDLQALSQIRRSKVERITVQKTSMFGLGEVDYEFESNEVPEV
ncbi:hypothetical protein Ahy_A05g024890 [Arachis hypogaea]|uniref:Uncharacterized protein n=1 Tax=Arachis hypogaea TaxID=3818 RepID=A0A445D7T4_ARAHY|nr:hypothetical protein Ahy_A05g024890 [Arachis hypogaea]